MSIPDEPHSPTHLTAEQIARDKQVSLSTIKRATRSGVLKSQKVRTKKDQKRFQRRYRKEDVDRWLSMRYTYLRLGGDADALTIPRLTRAIGRTGKEAIRKLQQHDPKVYAGLRHWLDIQDLPRVKFPLPDLDLD